jgi:hypothetical protein
MMAIGWMMKNMDLEFINGGIIKINNNLINPKIKN